MTFKIVKTCKGYMALSWNEAGSLDGVLLPFSNLSSLRSKIEELWPDKKELQFLPQTLQGLDEACQQYFEGKLTDFTHVPIETGHLTEFQKQVYLALRKVSFGQTLSYKDLAVKVGRAGASRAVGSCMSRNKIPLVVPCHRVIAASGRIGHFSAEGGAEMKKWMLDLEGRAS